MTLLQIITNDTIRQELINSNEMLRVQIWIMGGLISFLLVMLIAVAKSMWNDTKKIIDNLAVRVDTLEKKDVGTSRDISYSREMIEQLSIKMDLFIERNT